MKIGALIESWRSNPSNSPITAFLLLLLGIDFVFFFLHFLPLFGVLNDPLFSLEEDGGYPERYQYAKIFSIIVLLIMVSAKAKVIGYGAWAVLFLYLLLDDALSIHELLGHQVATSMDFLPAFGLRARDFGELVVTGIAATLLLAPLAVFYLCGTSSFRTVSRYLFLLLVALAFFGIFVDMLHVAIQQGWKVSFLLGALEDGGEMIVMSMMAAYVFLLYWRNRNAGSLSQPTI
ncbi:hypothetical protein [Woeseia oceani]|uniref:Uncharacterized protein n=1 Tax=Woeseia oceani TaxID=1548547 RepID=A0A193LDD2_9GAMM|nr:hypothetical protein [Woeseia oceani]ANO50488.1 hypothetical protein BA177_04015 [Woeseia oceani]